MLEIFAWYLIRAVVHHFPAFTGPDRAGHQVPKGRNVVLFTAHREEEEHRIDEGADRSNSCKTEKLPNAQ